MSDEILHQSAPAPAVAEVVQPSVATEVANPDGTGASETVAESEAEKAERIVQERKVRQERARRNQEAAFNRLSAERDEFKQLAKELALRGQSPQQPAQATGQAPQREQFDTWEAYEDARVDWKLEQKTAALQEKQARELAALIQQSQTQQYEQQLTEQHGQRLQEYAKSVPDFAEVTDRDDVQIPAVAGDAIRSMPNGPAIVYAIGKDPSIAERMQYMRPAEQAAFVGQLSAALMARVPQVSKAPPPGEPVGGKSSAPPTLESASYDEFVKLRRKQIAARR